MDQQDLLSPSSHSAAHVENQQRLTVTLGVDTTLSQGNKDDAGVSGNEPASLEGVLYWRKGRSFSSTTLGTVSMFWTKRYVVLDLIDGSLSCYRFTTGHKNQGTPTYIPQKKSSKLHRRGSMGESIKNNKNLSQLGESDVLALRIPAEISWHVKDVSNDSSSFVVEVVTQQGTEVTPTSSTLSSELDTNDDKSTSSGESYFADADDQTSQEEESSMKFINGTAGDHLEDNVLNREIKLAKEQGKPLRFYFKCLKGGNEKVLWLKAFSRIHRMSSDFQRKKSVLTSLKAPAVRLSSSRTRSAASAAFARESKELDATQELDSSNVSIGLNFSRRRGCREKEHRVLPESVYPHVWMTESELREEMEKPSEVFYDLRKNKCQLDVPNNPSKRPEIGSLKLEILQGLGFPKLDRYSQTDAVVYVVCGPYAFCTDVIKNKASPIWLSKTQRACDIPLHHGFARVYIGVFDDEKSQKDDFNGRVVLDVSRLRPGSTYDVTLPLRLSAHVYSRRRRGAIRLRFRLEWSNLRGALLSYLPEKVSRPRNFRPNVDTFVACGSSRAFRNVAITAHGAHLPGRFSFQQLRATLREINFTRKQVMNILKITLKELREWDNVLTSAFVFFAWMHCVYMNAFSLVPAYVASYFMLLLFRNYARYGMDGPAARGFVPPSWEELLLGLLQGPNENRPSAIAPLNMRYETETINNTPVINYTFETHEPRGKVLFRAMGFMNQEGSALDDTNVVVKDHLEFPFADGKIYPKFKVTDSLVSRKKRLSTLSGGAMVNTNVSSRKTGVFPQMPRMMRKDKSGMNDYDCEEQRFGTVGFIRKTGTRTVKEAASGLIDVGDKVTEVTGLQYVVSPITGSLRTGVHYLAPPIKSGIRTGYKTGKSGAMSGYKLGKSSVRHVVSPLTYVVSPLAQGVETIRHSTVESIRRSSNELFYGSPNDAPALDDPEIQSKADGVEQQLLGGYHPVAGSGTISGTFDDDDVIEVDEYDDDEEDVLSLEDVDDDYNSLIDEPPGNTIAGLTVPDQDIDYDANAGSDKKKSRKRLTDDLNEVKEKMHELTLHKFNDRTYVVKNSNSRYFGHHNRSAKRRKLGVSQNLDKLLNVGQYSHSNPVVARVGQYVEPIVGASHSFLCAFRALFNVMTWRDPFLTFWVSLFGFALVIILFIFPWRLFLFFFGLWFVGPQNYAIRIMRKRGILPPKKIPELEAGAEDMEVSADQVVFQGHISQDEKKKAHKPVDPREVQYAVVPYSPLMSQRFYDWPPERDYAQVRPDVQQSRFVRSNSSFGADRHAVSFGSRSVANGRTSSTSEATNAFFSSVVALPSEKKTQ